MTAVLVALGAMLGATARYEADLALRRLRAARRARTGASGREPEWPWATLAVNLVGSLALGILVGAGAPDAVLAFAGTGLCGALTTYSTLSWEVVALFRGGRRAVAVGYLTVTLLLGLACAAAGRALAA